MAARFSDSLDLAATADQRCRGPLRRLQEIRETGTVSRPLEAPVNAISTPLVPHTVRVPVELRELVSVMLERGEIAPGAVAGTLQHAMRYGLAAAVEGDDQPRPRRSPKRRRRRILAEAVALARLERTEGVARAVTVAREYLAAGITQRALADTLNGLGLLNTRRLVPVKWTVFSLARALSSEP